MPGMVKDEKWLTEVNRDVIVLVIQSIVGGLFARVSVLFAREMAGDSVRQRVVLATIGEKAG